MICFIDIDKTYSLFMYTMSYNLILIILIFFAMYKILTVSVFFDDLYEEYCGSCNSLNGYNLHTSRKLPRPIQLYENYSSNIKNQNTGTVQNISFVKNLQDMQDELNIQNKHRNEGLIDTQSHSLRAEIQKINSILDKLYQSDLDGSFLTHGWFVEFHNVVDHPMGIILGENLGKIYSAPSICFRAKESFPFLGTPENPIYFPKADNIGMRAMTVLKIPKTGYYDFRILSDDGVRFYYQKVGANIILNEKNARSQWIMIIDEWVTQAENWKISKKIYFNQNDLILLRMDYYEMGIFATACIKIRYYLDNFRVEESDPPFENTFCSLLWSEVPLLGVS